ncbi:DNA-binding transcriptional regulator YhcF (GntR family) [Saccharothrix ecbatanensis]|uniref:DNA-binding transcriptional regulator YhcF (GntR family) n=1 Tax=Saccharothrix ecbatanensis TaxID=1105145 RepID=A0A7W9M236_9PSEU|nr:TetR/AcrR family transcriptional regulator C-terminal domain-containing protein [Saccharothrix ecbatanensis]MBB5804599.1 DNA-binding transcriptional regulator YhcF (GntR family) [Saccharothrix ecbatanensis]
MTDAIYQRIAREIRDRIESGELRPGDRVPSTREITVNWNVAMATATKALFTLRTEGVVRPVAGVGTVVSSEGGETARPRAQETDLTGERLVLAAVRVADADGLDGMSMRRVASQLGVATMSLYRHVENKDELVLRMIDHVLGEEELPDPAPRTWRERLEVSARLQWRLFQEHSWLAPAMSMTRPQLLPSAITHTEWMLSALDGRGLSLEEMMHAVVTVFGFVRGVAVNIEPEAGQRHDTGITGDEWMTQQAPALLDIAATGRFPMFSQVIGTEVDMELDTLFEFGLARMLDGIGEWISGRSMLTERRTGM